MRLITFALMLTASAVASQSARAADAVYPTARIFDGSPYGLLDCVNYATISRTTGQPEIASDPAERKSQEITFRSVCQDAAAMVALKQIQFGQGMDECNREVCLGLVRAQEIFLKSVVHGLAVAQWETSPATEGKSEAEKAAGIAELEVYFNSFFQSQRTRLEALREELETQ